MKRTPGRTARLLFEARLKKQAMQEAKKEEVGTEAVKLGSWSSQSIEQLQFFRLEFSLPSFRERSPWWWSECLGSLIFCFY